MTPGTREGILGMRRSALNRPLGSAAHGCGEELRRTIFELSGASSPRKSKTGPALIASTCTPGTGVHPVETWKQARVLGSV